ncbi:MAG: UDP-glucose--hexose-1-phosphate uridylyltransferase, partial [Carnobacterium sp.]
MSNKGSQLIADFVTKIIHRGNWDEMDRFYLTNQIAHLIGEKELAKESEMTDNQTTILKSVEMLLIQAKENKVIGDSIAESDILEAQLMDFIMPSPSLVNQQFYQQYQHSPKKATDYFYELCKTTNYIKTKSVARNILFPAETSYGKLEITINLSKPEKDPKQIVAEKNTLVEHYPKCMLCMENEGYHGRMDYPARTNHRIIRMDLEGESWGFQYSPYAYYNEHAIILSTEHRPMKIGRETFRRLLSITEKLPHYFVGSNADLPIVGGSILAHDHYQAGRHTFPMATAEIETTFCLTNFKQVTAGIVKWPMSVIRLQSTSKNELIEAA